MFAEVSPGRVGPLGSTLTPQATPAEVQQLVDQLTAAGTFQFPTFPSGLFSAAASQAADFGLTGYQHVWVRDNVHIAHAHWRLGQSAIAANCVRSLLEFFRRSEMRFLAAFSAPSQLADPMRRPHIRFDGQRLIELPEKWAHAQNDALGGLLWLASGMLTAAVWRPSDIELQTLNRLARFLYVVRYWQDADSGHWEEVRKVSASSIGVALAGLTAYRRLLHHRRSAQANVPPAAAQESSPAADLSLGADLQWLPESIREGEQALAAILPDECREGTAEQRRGADAALLFLIYPYEVLTGAAADSVLSRVLAELQGPYGIRRYRGDSYWCADYKDRLSIEQRTADFSDDLSRRDQLLQPGGEAQWCLFDPIVSIAFALRHKQSGDPDDRRRQFQHLNRSLNHLTIPSDHSGPFRCPESYYCVRGTYVPNDVTPLLWTQANLRLALWWAAAEQAGEP